jgi:nitroreductase/NAD-dependent dihydropyrimidine dehydrogenase PreA subunit
MGIICVDTEKCKKDGVCMEACPTSCIQAGPDGFPEEAPGAFCLECGHCVAVCPHGALTNHRTPPEGYTPVAAGLPGLEAVSGLMRARRSVREFKKDRAIPRDTLAGLLEVARCAPTAVNSQKVGWIVCSDPALVRRSAEMSIEWMRASGVYPSLVERWDQGREVVLRGAPQFVAACAPTDYTWGTVDCTIALSYLELAVAAAGLGACWAGLLTRAIAGIPELAGLLGLPADQTVHGALMLGVPKYPYRLVPPRREAQVRWL